MRGTVARKGKRWYAVVDEGRDEQGRRRQRWHSGYRTKREAEAALAEIIATMGSGAYVKPVRQTVGLFLREWLDGRRTQIRPSTWHGYRKNIEAHVIPHIGGLALQQLTPQRLNTLYSSLPRRDGRGALSGRSIAHVHRLLHVALGDAVRWRLLPNNPADHADPPRPQPTEMSVWTPAELRAFLEHVRQDRLYAAWLLAGSTGLRRGELLGARWKDLDVGRLAVVQTLLDVGNQIRYSTPKTVKGRRLISLDPATVAALREHRKGQIEERLALGAWPDHDLMFTREDGEPIHPAWLTRAFRQRVKDAGVPRIRFHDLRHTHATIMMRAGIHPKVVSERLGHATVSITLDTYSHAVPSLQEDAAERAAAVVFGTG
ncbi:MAG: site-specific integrase [Chloroflexi bacterium]|nr:site-specific integrase [Chloroflexota bacterium]